MLFLIVILKPSQGEQEGPCHILATEDNSKIYEERFS